MQRKPGNDEAVHRRSVCHERRLQIVKTRTALAALAAIVICLPAVADDEPDRFTFKVKGVGKSDWLNIRERIEDEKSITATKIVGSMPPSTSGIPGTGASQMIGRQRWFEIRHGDIRGWVNGKFLEPGDKPVTAVATSDLFCAGTEPFWSVKITGKTAAYAVPGGEPQPLSIAVREPLPQRADTSAVKLSAANGPGMSLLVAPKEWCSDGMSDVDFGFEATLIKDGSEAKPLKGCCSLLR